MLDFTPGEPLWINGQRVFAAQYLGQTLDGDVTVKKEDGFSVTVPLHQVYKDPKDIPVSK